MASHFPSTTFCWFPPERFTTGVWIDGVLTRKRATSVSATRRSRRAVQEPEAGVATDRGEGGVLRDGHGQHQAVALAVLGSEVDPAPMASLGRSGRKAVPSSRMSPPRAGVAPKRDCISSVRPEPTRPAKPRISPRKAEKDTGAGAPGTRRPSTASTVSECARSGREGK